MTAETWGQRLDALVTRPSYVRLVEAFLAFGFDRSIEPWFLVAAMDFLTVRDGPGEQVPQPAGVEYAARRIRDSHERPAAVQALREYGAEQGFPLDAFSDDAVGHAYVFCVAARESMFALSALPGDSERDEAAARDMALVAEVMQERYP